jgi:hypothetical protein
MRDIILGGTSYRLVTVRRESGWVAHAERTGDGVRFGIDCAGGSEEEALDRLASWLNWQEEHASALDALQRAEADYHRLIAGQAFATAADAVPLAELQQAGLAEVEAARVRLDEVRARKPE